MMVNAIVVYSSKDHLMSIKDTNMLFSVIGYANRTCLKNNTWGPPDVLDCQRVAQMRLEIKARELELFDQSVDSRFNPEDLEIISRDLANITNEPIFPNDLCLTAITLDIMMRYVL